MNTPENRAALRGRDGWQCMLCAVPFDDPPPAFPDPKSVEVDHEVQVWKGGADTLDNLRLVHRRCNNKRQEEELSPAQMRRDEKARAHWAGVVGKEKANFIEAALHCGDEEKRTTAKRIMLAAIEAKRNRG